MEIRRYFYDLTSSTPADKKQQEYPFPGSTSIPIDAILTGKDLDRNDQSGE
jgi:hypothetical protein